MFKKKIRKLSKYQSFEVIIFPAQLLFTTSLSKTLVAHIDEREFDLQRLARYSNVISRPAFHVLFNNYEHIVLPEYLTVVIRQNSTFKPEAMFWFTVILLIVEFIPPAEDYSVQSLIFLWDMMAHNTVGKETFLSISAVWLQKIS